MSMKAVAAPKRKPQTHPKYEEMIARAIVALKERSGSSVYAIRKYILETFDTPDEATVVRHLRIALKKGIDEGTLTKIKASYKVTPLLREKLNIKKGVKKPAPSRSRSRSKSPVRTVAAKPKTAPKAKAAAPKKKSTIVKSKPAAAGKAKETTAAKTATRSTAARAPVVKKKAPTAKGTAKPKSGITKKTVKRTQAKSTPPKSPKKKSAKATRKVAK